MIEHDTEIYLIDGHRDPSRILQKNYELFLNWTTYPSTEISILGIQ